MLPAPTIAKDPKRDLALDHEQLYTVGLQYVQRLAARIWDDYNVHDPGITTLELLCYALTDLSYRASYTVKDLLASKTDNAAEMGKQFFTARHILPNRALTLLDYRKLLIDLKGVKNAWLTPSTLTYYADTIKGMLLKEDPGLPGIKPVNIRGLYDVLIEFNENVASTSEKAKVRELVKQKLQANRNLCEDFVNFDEIKTQKFLLCCEVELAPDADEAQIQAEILFRVEEYLAPSITNYTLAEMLARERGDDTPFSVDEIFDGPTLDCGFIDNEELKQAELRERVYLSDVISILMDIEGVRAVKDIVINPAGTTSALTDKWIVPVSAGKKPGLDRANCRFVFYKRNMPVRANEREIDHYLAELEDAARLKAETVATPAFDLEVPLGTYREPTSYYSFQNHFPALYGLSEYGLNGAADSARRALAYQLKGYLLFFDQVLADYFSQLGHVRELFSADPGVQRSYFFQVVNSFSHYEEIYRIAFAADDFIDLSSLAEKLKNHSDGLTLFLWANFTARLKRLLEDYRGTDAQSRRLKNALSEELNVLIEGPLIYQKTRFAEVDLSDEARTLLAQEPQPIGKARSYLNRLLLNDAWPLQITRYDAEEKPIFAERRNRFLDHLIARFAEQFTDFANIMYSAFRLSSESMIGVKCDFLKDYPFISSERSLAYNHSLKAETDLWNSENVSGLEKRLAKLLGLRNFTRRNLSDIAYDIYAEVDKTPDDEFRWRIYERETEGVLLSSSTKYLKRADAKKEMRIAISLALVPAGYGRKTTVDGRHYFNIVDGTGEVVGRRIEYFDSGEELEEAIAQLMEYLQAHYSDEGMYLIEAILLRPEGEDDPLPICPDPNCTDCAEEDPYSYRVHVILPAYSSRFSNMEFRRFCEEVIREEMPAHILPRICWVNQDDMASLEKHYRDWIYLEAGATKARRSAKRKAFIDALLTARNVYPPQRLHECDAPKGQVKFLLGQTALGTLEDETL